VPCLMAKRKILLSVKDHWLRQCVVRMD
jgi:hypothetical protein